jgi:hypothetical protein
VERPAPREHDDGLDEKPAGEERPRHEILVRKRREENDNERAGPEQQRNNRREPDRRRCGPREQSFRIADASFVGQHGHVFAEVEHRPELGDGDLPRAHFVDRSAGRQPAGEGFLAGFGARAVQAFEQRRAAEQIEIARIWVAVGEARAVAAGPHPAADQPVDPALVQAPRALGAIGPRKNFGVDDREDCERERRREKPPRGDAAPHRHDAEHDRGGDRDEAQVGKPVVRALVFDDALRPSVATPIVLASRIVHRASRCLARATYRSTAARSSEIDTNSSAVCAACTDPGPKRSGCPHAPRNGISVVYGNTAASNPGTVISRTGGTSRMCSIATRRSIAAMAVLICAPSLTVRNITSASADGDTTFGATPPAIRPTV